MKERDSAKAQRQGLFRGMVEFSVLGERKE